MWIAIIGTARFFFPNLLVAYFRARRVFPLETATHQTDNGNTVLID